MKEQFRNEGAMKYAARATPVSEDGYASNTLCTMINANRVPSLLMDYGSHYSTRDRYNYSHALNCYFLRDIYDATNGKFHYSSEIGYRINTGQYGIYTPLVEQSNLAYGIRMQQQQHMANCIGMVRSNPYML